MNSPMPMHLSLGEPAPAEVQRPAQRRNYIERFMARGAYCSYIQRRRNRHVAGNPMNRLTAGAIIAAVSMYVGTAMVNPNSAEARNRGFIPSACYLGDNPPLVCPPGFSRKG